MLVGWFWGGPGFLPVMLCAEAVRVSVRVFHGLAFFSRSVIFIRLKFFYSGWDFRFYAGVHEDTFCNYFVRATHSASSLQVSMALKARRSPYIIYIYPGLASEAGYVQGHSCTLVISRTAVGHTSTALSGRRIFVRGGAGPRSGCEVGDQRGMRLYQ